MDFGVQLAYELVRSLGTAAIVTAGGCPAAPACPACPACPAVPACPGAPPLPEPTCGVVDPAVLAANSRLWAWTGVLGAASLLVLAVCRLQNGRSRGSSSTDGRAAGPGAGSSSGGGMGLRMVRDAGGTMASAPSHRGAGVIGD